MSQLDDLERRIAALESRRLNLDDLPLAHMQDWLTNDEVQQSAQDKIAPHSVRENAVGMLPFCVVRRTANQSTNNATFTGIEFQAGVSTIATDLQKASNPYGMWRSTANTDRVYALRRGWYACTLQISWDANVAGTRFAAIWKNGALSINDWAQQCPAGPAGHGVQQIASGLIEMDVGDFVGGLVYQDSGGVLSVTVAKLAVYWQHDNVAPPLPA